MSKSFKEEHPLGTDTEEDDDQTFAICRDMKATDDCLRKKVSFSFCSDILDAARQFLDGIVTDNSVYLVEVSSP
jgi:predicted RNA binding protein with dsRBD fold (UPF0201 family)